MAGAGLPARVEHGEAAVVAILTDLEWPVLARASGFISSGTVTLRSSPTWNGRCWSPRNDILLSVLQLRSSPTWNGRCWRGGTAAPSMILTGCDPHRLGMAGAGPLNRDLMGIPFQVAILTDLEWPVLAVGHVL